MKKLFSLFLVFVFICSLVLHADSNVTITFQGRLISSIGSPVNGKRKMKFKIYNTETDNECILSSNPGNYLNGTGGVPEHSVFCNDGNYATEIVLTVEQSISLNGFEDAYLEVYVGLENVVSETDKMSPRIHLSATPFAMSAHQIYGLDIKRTDQGEQGTDVDILY